MSNTQTQALFVERMKAITELRTLADEAEGRELTAEEVETRDRVDGAIDALDIRIADALKEGAREERAAEFSAQLETSTPEVPEADVEMRQWEGLITGDEKSIELRDLTAGTATDGAELVATSTVGQIYAFMRENVNAVGAQARMVNTDSGGDLVFPTTTSFSAATIIAEGATVTESDPQFATVTLGAFKIGHAVQISSELEQDSAANVVGFVRDQGVEALARGMGGYFLTGTGSGQPNGAVNTTNANNVTFAGVAAITGDELIDVYHGLASPYRPRASFIVKDSTLSLIRKLKDGNGQYLWTPGLQADQPDTLLGRPVFVDDGIAVAATGNISVLFGDYSGYLVRMVGNVRVDRSAEFAFGSDLVTYRFLARVDGDILDNRAIVSGTQA